MSKIKALITALVLGTSSIAAADTSVTFSGRADAPWGTASPSVRDHRSETAYPGYQAPVYQAPTTTFARGTWVSLAEPMNLGRGRGSMIDLNSRALFNQIRLQSASGATFIGTVTVQYKNGASQIVTVNQWIDAQNPMTQFALNRTAQVDSIMINGSRNRRSGKIQVFGYASQTRPSPPIYNPRNPRFR
jgi:hypothetical protein